MEITNPHKVEHRKLGREKAHGLAWDDKNKIELDVRLTGYRYLLTALHEHFHLKHPDWSETRYGQTVLGFTSNDCRQRSLRAARALCRTGSDHDPCLGHATVSSACAVPIPLVSSGSA